MESYKFLDDYILVPCDGTGMFSSNSIYCDNCCEEHHKDGRLSSNAWNSKIFLMTTYFY